MKNQKHPVVYNNGIDPNTGIKYWYDEADVLRRTPIGRLSDGRLVYRTEWTNGGFLDLY